MVSRKREGKNKAPKTTAETRGPAKESTVATAMKGAKKRGKNAAATIEVPGRNLVPVQVHINSQLDCLRQTTATRSPHGYSRRYRHHTDQITSAMSANSGDSSDEEMVEGLREKMRVLHGVLTNIKRNTMSNSLLETLASVGHTAISAQIDLSDPMSTVSDPMGTSIHHCIMSLEKAAYQEAVVDIECHTSFEFFYILLQLANCIQEAGDTRDSHEQHLVAFRQRQVLHYLSYREALKEASKFRVFVAERINGIAPELQEMVLAALAKACLQRGMKFKQGDLATQAEKLLETLATTKLIDPWTKSKHCTAYHLYEYTNLDQLKQGLGALAEEAVVKSVTVLHPAEFPTATAPNRLPYPIELTAHFRHIFALNLLLQVASTSCTQYTTKIFQLQDNVTNIVEWTPNLKVLKVDIDYIATAGPTHENVDWMARGGKSITKFPVLLEGVVKALREVGIAHRSISYWESGNRRIVNTPDMIDRDWTVQDCIDRERLQKTASVCSAEEVVRLMMGELGTEFIV